MTRGRGGTWWGVVWWGVVTMLGLSACVGAAPPPPQDEGSTGVATPVGTTGPGGVDSTTTGVGGGSGSSGSSGSSGLPLTTGPLDTSTSVGPGSSDGGMSSTGPMGSSSSAESTGSMDDCHPIIVEALTALSGPDDGREWIILHNPCAMAHDLDLLTLAWGDELGYAGGTFDLSGPIPAGECYSIGGPVSDGTNFNPLLDSLVDFEPNLGSPQGAIGLFDDSSVPIDMLDIPIDVVIYGDANDQGYLDSTGAIVPPMVSNPPINASLRRTSLGATWDHGDPPTPNDCPGF